MSGPPFDIQLRNVSFGYIRGSDLIKNVNLGIPAGEVFCLMGPTGSGKSTVLKLVAGLLVPRAGEVIIAKEPSRALGMCFQKGGLIDSWNAFENIDFALKEMTSLSRQEREQTIERVLKEVGLEGALRKKPKELSGGMIKRLALARAIALQPQILILDEPTAGLDPVTALEIVQLIRNYQKRLGITLLVVTSELLVAYSLAETMALLWNREIICFESVEAFKKSQNKGAQQFVHGEARASLLKGENA